MKIVIHKLCTKTTRTLSTKLLQHVAVHLEHFLYVHFSGMILGFGASLILSHDQISKTGKLRKKLLIQEILRHQKNTAPQSARFLRNLALLWVRLGCKQVPGQRIELEKWTYRNAIMIACSETTAEQISLLNRVD